MSDELATTDVASQSDGIAEHQGDLLAGLSEAGAPPQDGQQDSPVQQTQQQTTEQQQRSLRDVIADSFGYQNARQWESDEAFVSSLIQDKVEYDARRRDLEIADSVKGNWEQYQNFLRSQQFAPQQPQQQEKPLFNPPPYDRSLDAQMRRDEHGVVRFLDGQLVPQSVLQQRFEHYRYINEFKEKLASDPEKVLSPYIERAVEQRLQSFRDEERKWQNANSIVEQNQHWLFTGPDRSQLTPAGQEYQRYLEEAKAFGIGNAAARDQYAQSKMELAYYRQQQQHQPQQMQQLQQQQPQNVSEAHKQNFLAATRKPRNGSGNGAGVASAVVDEGNLYQNLMAGLKDLDMS